MATVLRDLLSKPLYHHCLVTMDKSLLGEPIPGLLLHLYPMGYPNQDP